MVYITHIRTCRGPAAERIAQVCWHETASGRYGASTLEQIVQYIAQGNRVRVTISGATTVLRSADDLHRPNLLSLPRF